MAPQPSVEAFENTLAFELSKCDPNQTLWIEDESRLIGSCKIAHHRGSVFGSIGMAPQPSVEAFENTLAFELSKCDPNQTLWIEDESRLIGSCKIPDNFFLLMRQAPIKLLTASIEKRIENLKKLYSQQPSQALLNSLDKLKKRLGIQRLNEIKKAFINGEHHSALSLLLNYYDKRYAYGLTKHHPELNTSLLLT